MTTVAPRPLEDLIVEWYNSRPGRRERPKPPPPPDLRCEPPWKWVGGKRELLAQIQDRPDILPPREEVRTYHEPFVGGGALFFLRYAGVPAVLSDENRWLTVTYRMLAEHTDKVIDHLRPLVGAYNEWSSLEHPAAGHFYGLQRHRFHTPTMEPWARAAIFIFLRSTAFNGLYRVNAKGENNVSWNKARRVTLDEEKLRAAGRALRSAVVLNFDFEESVYDHVVDSGDGHVGRGRFAARPGDFCFLDPPYCPVSQTASFTAYAAGGDWGPRGKDRQRLIAMLHRMERHRIRFLCCDSDTPETREIYAPFRLETAQVSRAVNRDGTKRGAVSELLILPRRTS